MALPIQSAPKYKTNLPSNGLEIEYRPFLVKEQRNLLMIKDDDEEAASLDGIINLLKEVVSTELDYMSLPTYDIEYLFLKVRGKSVGETVKLSFPCQKNSEHAPIEHVLNLEKVMIDTAQSVDNRVMLTEDMGIVLKHPTVKDATELSLSSVDAIDTLEMMTKCMLQVFNSESVFEMSETPDREIREFVDSLTLEQLEKITEFFEDMPVLRAECEYTCPVCGTDEKQTMILEGIQAFF